MNPIATARKFLKQAGEYALQNQSQLDVSFKNNDENNLVTNVDKANSALAQQMLAPFLAAGDLLIDEENLPNTPIQTVLSHPGRVWVIDPIDGTKEYAKGTTNWGVLLTIYEGGTPVFAAVHMPAKKRSMEITPAGLSIYSTETGEQETPQPTPANSNADIHRDLHPLLAQAATTGVINLDTRSAAAITFNLATGQTQLMALPARIGLWDIAPMMALATQNNWVAAFAEAPHIHLTLSPQMFKSDWQVAGTLIVGTPEMFNRLYPNAA